MKYIEAVYLFYPSVRSIAYLDELIELGLMPKYFVWLGNDNVVTESLIKAWQEYRYCNFFNLNLSITLLKENLLITHYYVKDININATTLGEILSTISCQYLIYTGGGIVSSEQLIKSEKKWLHVHPGITPNYKGSTCFYYSYLQQESLGCSAFLLSKDLDRGELIEQSNFDINYPLQAKENVFIDYVLDPFIRKKTLGLALISLFFPQKKIHSHKPIKPDTWLDYYVIHPFLRKICAEKIKQNYCPNQPTGIFIKGNGS